MHISEGIVSAPVLISGAALAAVGTAIGLKKLDYERIPQVAVLSSAFFIASMVHVPIGPSNVHLVLSGLMGLLLGWVAFPAIFVGLLLQTILFQFGGLTSLGVNMSIMSYPAVVCFYAFRLGVRNEKVGLSMLSAFMCGFCSVLLGSILVALALAFTGESFVGAAKVIVIAHLPVMVIEGIIVAACVKFLKKVKPEILEVIYDD